MAHDIFDCIKKKGMQQLKEIISNDLGALTATDENGLTPLMTALYYHKQCQAEEIASHMEQMTIHEACAFGDPESVRTQVSANSNVITQRSADGFSPLHLAAFFCHKEITEHLLQHSAPANDIAENRSRVMPLHSAVAGGDHEIVTLLLDHGADIDARQEGGFTPLMAAAANGRVEIVQVLLDHGADTSMQSDDGHTALDFAEAKGQKEAAEILNRL